MKTHSQANVYTMVPLAHHPRGPKLVAHHPRGPKLVAHHPRGLKQMGLWWQPVTPISGTTSKRAIFKKPPAKGKAQSVKTINPEPTKGKAQSKWTHEADSDGEGSSGEYDPESTSDSSDEDVFYDSDYGLIDDDRMFEENIDREVEENTNTHGAEYESVIEELADIDGDCASSDELPSYSTSSNSDEKPRRTRRKPDEKHPVFNEQSDMGNPVFIRGMEFKTHSLFRDAVKEYAIKHGKQIRFLKSDREKVRAVCKKGCPWEIYASYVPTDALYRIKTYISQHTCTRTFDVPWVSSKWIVARYGNRIRSNPTWPVPSLAETIQQEWTVKVSIRKVYRAKNICLAMRDGIAIEQYKQLWGYADEVINGNPGTTIKIETKPVPGSEMEVKFKRFYICWGALKRGFQMGCRPIIGLDGCHLKGPYGGILLTAVGIDANNQIYPFAYAVVDKEKYKTWAWFLELLGTDLDIQNSGKYTFMSDKQKGLIEAVRNLFPDADHRFCVRHLYNNFKQDFKGLVLKDILWKAARASTVQSFNRAMGEMKDIDVKAYEWLIQRPSVNWSRSQFSSYTKCDILLNNLCESFNSSILRARDQPIVSMLERIRLILMDTLQKKRTAMMRYKGLICPKIVKRIEKMRENEKGWIPRWCSDYEYEVTGPYGKYKVYLDKRHCGCRKWDISGIPCIHAIAAMGFNNLEPLDYVDDWYSVDTYLKTYDNLMGPINGREMWPSPDNVELLPPDVKKRPGRPKKARRREPDRGTNCKGSMQIRKEGH
ncbi:hypothetical protein Vadar_020699 [Vaccinium darrowii]|uniref:Uncharacterized protein n=1 Tax=Vaccinium darrowii TaxID=229202 RepID=A0ACB7X2I3_9ERIC|nr:hypothetical protein Vadar_020699 [Vaccinium darrowii]